MDASSLPMIPTGVASLESMAYADLEQIKSQLDVFRHRILALQNAQSALFRLPGELRNKIFLFAMYGELQDRKQNKSRQSHGSLYKQPSFFNISRQVKAECTGVWFNDVLVWEEFDAAKAVWRRLDMDEVERICKEKSDRTGELQIVVNLAHCDLGRTRAGVEGSRSICSRKGLVRVEGGEGMGIAQLRWWVW